MKNRIISPSLLSADFSRLKSQIDLVVDAGAERLHLDVWMNILCQILLLAHLLLKLSEAY